MVVGGEFEIDFKTAFDSYSKLPEEFRQGHFYSSGRAALYHIINLSKQLGKGKILLPSYLCESIVEVVKRSSTPYEFYTLNQDLTVNVDSLKEIFDDNCSILIINYFGGIDVQIEIQKVKNINSRGFIILDNVQALFSMFEPLDVDFMFTSFRKQLPVPDGAWVISKHDDLYQCDELNTFAQYKLAGGLLKNFQRFDSVSDQVYLKLLEKGETSISDNLNAKISEITINILGSLDFDSIRQKRTANANYIIDALKKRGLKPILNFHNNMVPLFIPMVFKNRDTIRRKLREHNIFCPVHWPRLNEIATKSNKLYDNELSLVIDQRYDKNDLSKIISIIEDCIKK